VRGKRTGPLIAALSASIGCAASSPIDLGTDPDLLWWTDFESCALTDWPTNWEAGGGHLQIANQPVRSGRCSVSSADVPQPAGTISAAVLINTTGLSSTTLGLPNDAYESAWFYVPLAVTSVGYWEFFKLGSRQTADDPATAIDVWDFDLQPDGAGGLRVTIIPRIPGVPAPPTLGDATVPIGRWFQIEAHLRASPGGDGVLQLWLDGILLFEVDGPTTPTSAVTWTIGGACESLATGTAQLYVDDAAIAKRRLGPDFPVFVRK
jgi:hypothetical protein